MAMECNCMMHPQTCYRTEKGTCVFVASASRTGSYVIVCRTGQDRTVRYPPLNNVVFDSEAKAQKYLAVYAELMGLERVGVR